MPRPKGSTKAVPAYCRHKGTGQAYVNLSGRFVYLGAHGTDASRAEYDRVIAEWLNGGRTPPPTAPPPGDAAVPAGIAAAGPVVVELIARYWKHAESYYAGERTTAGEVAHIKGLLTHLKRLYGRTPIAEFGPLAMKALREHFIRLGWSRRYCNAQCNRLRRVFKWGVENEIVPAAVYQALAAVAGLRKGKTSARETRPVGPVPVHLIAPVRALLAPTLQAMIDLQLLTGMRPGELCRMRTRDIDTTGKLWTYKPDGHKTEHHGHERIVYLGPKAQSLLKPLLKPDLSAYLFDPREVDAWHRQQRREKRNPKTPVTPSQRMRAERAARRTRKRAPGERYDVAAYRQAVARACRRAFPVPEEFRPAEGDTAEQQQAKAERRAEWRKGHLWKPHMLRHSAATRLRKEFGLEAAQVILGHHTLTVTQVYAEKNVEAAVRIMGEVG